MNNTSAKSGFLLPNPEPPVLVTVPPKLTLVQFIQQLLTGLSAFPGQLVRPDWQQNPPKQPDIDVNWLAFGIEEAEADANAYVNTVSVNNLPVTTLQRNELLPVTVSVYGPASYDNITMIRDGFQIQQNLDSLRQANIGFGYDTRAQHVPDFFNERWYDRWRMQIFLRRQVQRLYPILSFVSASGVVFTQTMANENYQINYAVAGD